VTDKTDRTFRLGDRVCFRVAAAHRPDKRDVQGDVVGTDVWINGRRDDHVFVGWADGTKTWEKPIELRLVTER